MRLRSERQVKSGYNYPGMMQTLAEAPRVGEEKGHVW